APHGYDPDMLVKSIWQGTAAMIKNDGSCRNEEAFWQCFAGIFGEDARKDEPLFADFYEHEFQNVQKACGYDPRARQVIDLLKEKGCTVVLATNPLFPAVATESRIRWAGLEPSDFALYTTYENSSFCKPNPAYYREILEKLELDPKECIMVGNDVGEDMITAGLGMQVFLLTDCLINKDNADISALPQGGFDELLAFLQENI
ncbi:MAG: HAD family hydrolase, partial [Oscillospiraceae bacterium]|nr:HAD family hydrolase [Oscillospiraceae bacterium]